MTITSLFTDGWLVDPIQVGPPVYVVQQVLSGNLVADDTLSGSLVGDDQLSGVLGPSDSLSGSLSTTSLTGTLSAATGALVGILSCDGVTMADITLTRGDSRTFQLTVYQSDGVTPVDLTNAVLRFAVKERYGQENAASKVFKTSYTSDQIEITDAVNGQCVVYLRIADTNSVEPGRYVWEVELTRRDILATSAGLLAFTAGSSVAQGTGLDFSALGIGQYLEPLGALSGNNVPVLITAINESAGTITFDGYSGFSTESGVAFNCYEGDRKTPDGFSGAFIIQPDVIR